MGKPNARDRILDAAAELFHRDGYSNVGINEIIARADTAKASFYQHFPSKESLCEAWLQRVHERSEISRSEILQSDLSAEEKVGRYFDELTKFLLTCDFRGCPYSNTSAMVDAKARGIYTRIQSHKRSVRKFFRALIEMEFGDTPRTTEVADQIFLLYSGATSEAQNIRELWPVNSARAGAVTLLRSLRS